MDPVGFQRKVNAIQRNIDQGRAVSNIPHGVSDAARRQLTQQYRRQLVNRIKSLYKNNPTAMRNALNKLKNSDIDHILDLQLGGGNVRSNLKTLESFTNQDLGRQISRQLPRGEQVPVTGLEVID